MFAESQTFKVYRKTLDMLNDGQLSADLAAAAQESPSLRGHHTLAHELPCSAPIRAYRLVRALLSLLSYPG